MQFIYTEHAEENIGERKLSKKAIEETVKNPDKCLDTRFGRKIAQRRQDRRLLRVVYEQTNNA